MVKLLSKEILSTEQQEGFSKSIKPSIWHQLQIWVDDQGRYHREDGPAIINKDGSMEWHIHGVITQRVNQEGYFLDGRSCSKQEIEALQMYKNAGKK